MGDWNADVRQGVSLASGILQGALSVTSTPSQIVTSLQRVNWVVLQHIPSGANNVYWGGSTLTNSGATRGPALTAGTPVSIPVSDLSLIWLVADSGTETVLYAAGVA